MYVSYESQNKEINLFFLIKFSFWGNKWTFFFFLGQQLSWIFIALPLFLNSQNCFELYIPDNKDQVIKACKTEADGRVVEGNHTVYRISAPTPEEKEDWIKCIK